MAKLFLKNKGFSLIEVLLVTMFVTIGFLSIFQSRRKSNIDDFHSVINQINTIIEDIFLLSIESSNQYKITFFFNKKKKLTDIGYQALRTESQGEYKSMVKKRITSPLLINKLILNNKDCLEEGTKEVWFFFKAGAGQEIFLTIPKDAIAYNYVINPLRGLIEERL